MTELRRYNEVPKIVGTDTNFVYEADDNGQVVFADNAITALRERDERIDKLEVENACLDHYGKQEYRIENLLREDLEKMHEENAAFLKALTDEGAEVVNRVTAKVLAARKVDKP